MPGESVSPQASSQHALDVRERDGAGVPAGHAARPASVGRERRRVEDRQDLVRRPGRARRPAGEPATPSGVARPRGPRSKSFGSSTSRGTRSTTSAHRRRARQDHDLRVEIGLVDRAHERAARSTAMTAHAPADEGAAHVGAAPRPAGRCATIRTTSARGRRQERGAAPGGLHHEVRCPAASRPHGQRAGLWTSWSWSSSWRSCATSSARGRGSGPRPLGWRLHSRAGYQAFSGQSDLARPRCGPGSAGSAGAIAGPCSPSLSKGQGAAGAPSPDASLAASRQPSGRHPDRLWVGPGPLAPAAARDRARRGPERSRPRARPARPGARRAATGGAGAVWRRPARGHTVVHQVRDHLRDRGGDGGPARRAHRQPELPARVEDQGRRHGGERDLPGRGGVGAGADRARRRWRRPGRRRSRPSRR